MAKTLTPKEIAQQFGTNPKTLRKFLRSDAKGKGVESPGKGGRWAIPATSLKSLQKRFDAWKAVQALEAQKRRDALASTESDTEDEAPEGDAEVEVLDDAEGDDAEEIELDA